VADQDGFGQTGGIHQGDDEIGSLLHAGRRLADAAAVARQVDRQHVPAVVCQIAGLQNPDAVVVQYAVDEDDGGLGRIKRFATGVAVGGGMVDGEIHGNAC
jgi:hypothetical protein